MGRRYSIADHNREGDGHMTAYRNRTRLGVEQLENRCMPSAVLGVLPAHVPAVADSPPAAAHVGASQQNAVPIRLSDHITSDGSGALSISGVGGHLGHWTGEGDLNALVIDPVADRGSISGVATVIAANGDQLFASFSASWQLSTGVGEVTVIYTGGTGRFAGATGEATEVCHLVADPSSPLTFECNSEGSGTLILAHR
jgi:hypothetical protein